MHELSKDELVDAARRLGFTLSETERATGLAGDGLPLDVRLDNALQAAMASPQSVSDVHYRALYLLREKPELATGASSGALGAESAAAVGSLLTDCGGAPIQGTPE